MADKLKRVATERVLIISASIGGGHVAAARALEAAFLERGVEVTHVDLLDYTTPPFRRLYRQAYFDLVRTAPEFVDWLGRRLDRTPGEQKSRQERLRAGLTRLVSFYLPRLIGRYQPDIIVHTHFLAPELLSTRLAPDILQLRGSQTKIPQVVVITDFFAHSFWFQPGIARYFVASEEVAVHLEFSGVDPERIVVSGIPIDLRFSQLEAKPDARHALDYPEDRDVLLVMAGGLDTPLVKKLVAALKDLRWPLTATFIFGRSAGLLELAARETAEHEGLVSFDLLGFSRDVPTYMSAADLLVGKPGGLTSSEALAARLPFAIVQPYPVQEEANTSYLLENGAALRIEPLSVFNYKVKHFFETPEQRERMQSAAERIAKKNAAKNIVRSLLEDSDFKL